MRILSTWIIRVYNGAMRSNRTFPLFFFLISVFILVALSGISPLPQWVILSKQRADLAFDNQSYYVAYSEYEKILKLLPYQMDIQEKAAESALKIGLMDEGKQKLEWLAKEGSLSAHGLLTLAGMYQDEGNFSLALSTYHEVPSASEESVFARKNLFKIYVTQENWIKARESLGDNPESMYKKIALDLFIDPQIVIQSSTEAEFLPLQLLAEDLVKQQDNPSYLSSTWIRIGQALSQHGENELAQAAYQQAIKQSPDSGLPWAFLGGFLASLGKDGEQEIQKSLNLEPDNFIVNQTAGYVFLQNNKPEVALIYLKKANNLIPANAQTLILLSRAEMEIGQYQQALIHWAEAAPLSDSPAQVWRDLVLFTLENPIFLRDYGLPAVRKLLQQDEASADDYDLAARVYLVLEDPLTAEKFWRNAMEKFPLSYLSHFHLGVWLVEKGSYMEGLEFIQLAADQKTDFVTGQKARQWLSDR